MLSLYLTYLIIGTIHSVLEVILGVLIILLIFSLAWKLVIVVDIEKIPKPDSTSWESWLNSSKLFWKVVIPISVLVLLVTVIPKKEETVTIIALYQADKYLENNPNSSLHPKKIVSTLDNTAGELEKFMSMFPKVLTRTLEVADKGLGKLEKRVEE